MSDNDQSHSASHSKFFLYRAGFFPGAIYLCSYWYMPRELALRISYFYCASALSGAFSGLLAAAIAKMDGIAGLEGWRWIFILEGLASVVLGVACFFLLIDTPALSKRWLSPEEIRYLELSMFVKQGGASTGESGFKWRDLKVVLMNWRIYVQAYLLFCQSALSYGNSRSNPIRGIGLIEFSTQVPSSPSRLSPKPWDSAPQMPSSPPPLHTLPARYLPSCLHGCLIASIGECHLSASQWYLSW